LFEYVELHIPAPVERGRVFGKGPGDGSWRGKVGVERDDEE